MRTLIFASITVMFLLSGWATAITLEQVISRENSGFNTENARLIAGRDGRVYLSSTADPGYVISMNPDGTDRRGFAIGHANELTAVNKTGAYALRQAHFAHTAALFNADGRQFGTFTDLDNQNYDAPQDIAVAASGDFYLLDGRYTNRIIRLNGTTGKLVAIYSLPKPGNMYHALQVNEATSRFYLSDYAQPMKIIGFDGKLISTAPQFSPFTVADDGSFWLLPGRGDTLSHYSPDGEVIGKVVLDIAERRWLGDNIYFTWLGLLPNGEVVLKRNHPYELFARYELATGAFKGAVAAKHELLTVNYPSLIWNAGEMVPMTISFDGGGRTTAPRWRVWITPFGSANWQLLTYRDGQVSIPENFGGLYQLKISPELSRWQGGTSSEYLLHDIIEVRQPGSKGTLNVLTPQNRWHYGCGETISVSLIARANPLPTAATIELWEANGIKPLLSLPLQLAGKETPFTLSARITTVLRPGAYRLLATAAGLTSVAQEIMLGPGKDALSPFRIMLHGDYGATRPTGNIWTAADVTSAHVKWAENNRLNFFIDRFNFTFSLGWPNNNDGRGYLDSLKARLERDPLGTAPEKAELLFADGETVAAYGAAGMGHMGLLCNMDAGLPLGTGFDARTREQFADTITKYSEALKNFPGWLGWDWVANWWIYDYDKRFANPEEKARYQTAWKNAEQTGAWDSVLETVTDRGINWQVEAQSFFNDTFRAVVPGRMTASSGPYRRPEVYSPISFANVDAIDLQYQAEQITTPYWTATADDFYRRPGKPTFLHPEMWNDTGTGEQVLPMTWLALMRGSESIGNSGFFPNWGRQPLDWRNGYHGLPGVYRALFSTVAPLGPWLQTLAPRDTVAVLISRRMVKIDPWTGIGGRYFTRQWEAYMSLLYARTPAQWLYLEDITPDTWKRFKAVIAVGQSVEPEAEWTAALKQASAAGLTIFADGVCRPGYVPGAKPLGVSFDGIEKIPCFNDDSAYWAFPERLVANAKIIAPILAPVVAPVATVEEPEVLVSERFAGQGRFIWVVNNTHNPLPAELLYRVNLAISSQLPIVANITLPDTRGKAVYDIFEHTTVTPDAQGIVRADLRTMDAKLYAILPKAIAGVGLRGPKTVTAGQPFSCAAWVQDAAGTALDANLPVHLALRNENSVLAERDTVAKAGIGAASTFTAPISGVTTLTLEATEMISGRTSSLTISVTPTRLDNIFTANPPALAPMTTRGSAVTRPLPTSPFAARLREMALSADSQTAYFSALQWGDNLYALDLKNGKMNWQKRVGQYWALGVQRFGNGLAAGGFDFSSAEGYHIYTLAADGTASRRFAVYGLPTETASIFMITVQENHRTLGFASAASGSWVAASGDLGVAVWAADGKKLWSLDHWTDGKRHEPSLITSANETLLIIDGLRVRAVAAPAWQLQWEQTLAVDGEVTQIKSTPDGKTIAFLTTVDGGRVFILRDGKIIDTVPVKGEEFALSADGTTLLVTEGNQLKLLQVGAGLLWNYSADAILHFPTISPDGKRIAVSSETGSLLVADSSGDNLRLLDLGSVAQTAWLPNGDLLAATWLGTVVRYDASLVLQWTTQLQPGGTDGLATNLLKKETVPTTRMTGWSNAAPADAALPAALLGKTTVTMERGDRSFGVNGNLNLLVDGQMVTPAQSYISTTGLNPHSGNSQRTAIILDRGKNLIRLDSLTFYEDETHPESWLRDVELEVWDAPTRIWKPLQRLLSDTPVHLHLLAQPVEGSRFRVLLPPFPYSNIRLQEIVLAGADLGLAYPPDVRAKKAVAVLFDDNISDLAGPYQNGFNMGYSPKNQADAYSGAAYFTFDPAKNGGLTQLRPMSDIDTWMHPIAENPQPGEYRWLQLAIKRLSPDLKSIKIWLGHPDVNPVAVLPLKPVDDWQLLRFDLWALQKRALNITQIFFAFENGPGAIDQIVLGRSEADLDGVKPVKQ